MSTFRVMDEPIEFSRLSGLVSNTVRKRGDAALAGQLSRAADSVALNIAEGLGFRGARWVNHYRIALGSGREAVAGIRLAIAKGRVQRNSRDVVQALYKANFICGALYKAPPTRSALAPRRDDERLDTRPSDASTETRFETEVDRGTLDVGIETRTETVIANDLRGAGGFSHPGSGSTPEMRPSVSVAPKRSIWRALRVRLVHRHR